MDELKRDKLRWFLFYEKKESISTLANYLGISLSTLYRRLDGTSKWTHQEVCDIAERYDMTSEQVKEYF